MIKRVLVSVKTLLLWAITGSATLLLACCYGMPSNYKYLGNWRVRTTDDSNQPIPGLQMSLLCTIEGETDSNTSYYGLTDTLGETEFSLYSDTDCPEGSRFDALIQDNDSTENGAWRDTVVTYVPGQGDTTPVVMRPVE